MDATDRDDVRHALYATMEFYGKRVEPGAERIWFSALRDHDTEAIRRAFAAYTRQGRYAPKPVDILELLAKAPSHKPANDHPYTPCPENIRKAWMWFNRLLVEGTSLSGLFGEQDPIDPKTQEEYLQIVNEQAKLYNQPDAIPEEYRLKEIWG